MNLGAQPNRFFRPGPFTPKRIQQYIEQLAWSNPWGAASHVNHLLFFLVYDNTLADGEKQALITLVERCLSPFQRDDGAFYPQHAVPKMHQKIGSAMKILMGMSLAGRVQNWVQPALIDLLLEASREDNACVDFNTIYALTRALTYTPYRQEEAREFLLNTLSVWKNEYYWDDYGAFSFFKQKATTTYYGAPVTRGLPEPDLHGTAMFCWGVYIIAEALGIAETSALHEPIL